MHANKSLSTCDIKCEIVPTPRQISSECGFSILGEVETFNVLKDNKILDKIKYDKIYIIKGEDYENCRW